MTDEQKQVNMEEIKAALAAIGPDEEGRYAYANRKPPEGYVTLRDAYTVAESHPSWLRTLISNDGLSRWDVEGAPAVIKNKRGVWALRIDALLAYEQVKRTPGEGTGEGGGYKYEPMVLKSVKRAATAVMEYAAVLADPEATKADLDTLVEYLKAEWEAGNIGKEASEDEDEGEDEGGDTKAEPGAADEDEDFEFDFEGVED